MEAILNFDFAVLNWIQNNIASPFFNTFFELVTHLGDGAYFWFAIALVSLFFKKTRKMGICMVLAIIFGSLMCNVTIKPLVARPRPFTYPQAMLGVTDLLIKKPSEFSFPSGHTTSCFAAATAILLYNKKWGIGALIIAALVGLSRMYLYVHFPTDVLAGVIVGCIAGILACTVIKYLIKNKEI